MIEATGELGRDAAPPGVDPDVLAATLRWIDFVWVIPLCAAVGWMLRPGAPLGSAFALTSAIPAVLIGLWPVTLAILYATGSRWYLDRRYRPLFVLGVTHAVSAVSIGSWSAQELSAAYALRQQAIDEASRHSFGPVRAALEQRMEPLVAALATSDGDRIRAELDAVDAEVQRLIGTLERARLEPEEPALLGRQHGLRPA
jgi:hypothetical protein